MVLLDSGFTPRDSIILREKLHAVVKKSIDSYVLRYRFDVPMSCSALIVPGKLLPYFHDSLC
jgi:RNA-dependent RNA polymerase